MIDNGHVDGCEKGEQDCEDRQGRGDGKRKSGFLGVLIADHESVRVARGDFGEGIQVGRTKLHSRGREPAVGSTD